jgi:hypothetical protein
MSGFGRFFIAQETTDNRMNHLKLPKWQRIALPVVIIALGIFYFSKYFVADELIYANYEVQALKQELQGTLDQLAEENTRATVAEREVDVVRQANAILRASERDRQNKIASLQADLALYRRLGGANDSQAALAVHHLELQATESPRVYRVIFTLTQNLRWASVISGRIHLGIDGIRNGVAQQLNEKQLLAESTEPLSFRFKYFQHLERLITLPEGFEPNRLSISLRSNGLQRSIEQSMQWQSLFNQNSSEIPENSD